MKNPFYKSQSLLAILTLLIVCSCGEENHVKPDVSTPEVTISTSTNSTTVWNTVTLTVTATGDLEIDKLGLKIDGQSVGEASSSPYEFSWDTNETSEGPHTVTATLTDMSGKEWETEVELNVRNTLLEAAIRPDMLLGQERGFIFLSDEEGKVIIAQEFINGDAVALKVPSFDGVEFTINEVITDPWHADYTLTKITTTTHVGRGPWVLKSRPGQHSPAIASMSFINRDDNLDYLLHTNDLVTHPLYGTKASGINLRAAPCPLYVTSTPREGSGISKYHVFNPIVAGTNPDPFDLAMVDKPMTEETVSLPEGRTSGSIALYGLRQVDNNTSYIYEVGRYRADKDGQFTLQYPPTAFDSFLSITSLSGGTGYNILNVSNSNDRYDFEPLEGTLSVSRDDRELTLAATGEMDVISIDLSHNHLNWTLFTDKNTTHLMIPEVPSLLNDVVNLDVDISGARLNITGEAYPQIEDYASFLDFIRSSNHGKNDLTGNFVSYKHISK